MEMDKKSLDSEYVASDWDSKEQKIDPKPNHLSYLQKFVVLLVIYAYCFDVRTNTRTKVYSTGAVIVSPMKNKLPTEKLCSRTLN